MMGPATTKHQARTHRLKTYVGATIESEAWPAVSLSYCDVLKQIKSLSMWGLKRPERDNWIKTDSSYSFIRTIV